MGKNVRPENFTDATLQQDKKETKAEHTLQEVHSQFSKEMQQANQEGQDGNANGTNAGTAHASKEQK
jgi:hypothetical protein